MLCHGQALGCGEILHNKHLMVCSSNLHEKEVRLIGLLFEGSSFLPFLNTKQTFVSFKFFLNNPLLVGQIGEMGNGASIIISQ